MDRLARNSIIQGMCSDFSLISAYLLTEYIFKNNKGKYQVPDEDAWLIINLIHDSAEFEIPNKDIYTFLTKSEKFFTTRLVKTLTKEFGMKINVPFEVEYDVGKSLDKMTTWNSTLGHAKELHKQMNKKEK
jgi:hypothetical protein